MRRLFTVEALPANRFVRLVRAVFLRGAIG
jgi:hypothetical protein